MDLQDPALEVEDCGKKEEEGSCGQLCDTVSVCVLSCELQQPVSSAKTAAGEKLFTTTSPRLSGSVHTVAAAV